MTPKTNMTTRVVSGGDLVIRPEDIPEHRMLALARFTLHAVERYFAKPGVQEAYEAWLVEYRKTHPEKTEH